MNGKDGQFDAASRQGNHALIESASGGQLWEDWRLQIERRLNQVNNLNEDRALLERALRE